MKSRLLIKKLVSGILSAGIVMCLFINTSGAGFSDESGAIPVSIGSLGFVTEWTMEPVEEDSEIGIDTDVALNKTAFTVKSKASGKYLTAIFNDDGTAELCTLPRDEANDAQLWIFFDSWVDDIYYYCVANLGKFVESNGKSYAAMLYRSGSGLKFKALSMSGEGNYSIHFGGSDNNSIETLRGGDGSFSATVKYRGGAYYWTEKYISDPSENAGDKKTLSEVMLDGEICGAESLKFTPAEYVTYYNGSGAAEEAVAYLIESEKSGGYLTAAYNEDGSVQLTFDTRDASDESQLWILRESWESLDTNWYSLGNLGMVYSAETSGGTTVNAVYQLNWSGTDKALVTAAVGNSGNGSETWMLNGGGAADSEGHLSVGIEDIADTDGSFSASLSLRSPEYYIIEDDLDIDASANVKIAASGENERFDIDTVDKNAAYRWHIRYSLTYDGVKYYTVKNMLTGTYLTMYRNGIYLAELKEGSSHQLWSFTDASEVDAEWSGAYLLRCLGHKSDEINVWNGNMQLLDENGLSYFDTSDKLNAGGIAWTLIKNRSKTDISDDMIAVINSYQWSSYGSNYYLCSRQAIYGDINGDDSVDVRDLVNMKKQSSDADSAGCETDMDADGLNARASDLALLRRLLMGI